MTLTLWLLRKLIWVLFPRSGRRQFRFNTIFCKCINTKRFGFKKHSFAKTELQRTLVCTAYLRIPFDRLIKSIYKSIQLTGEWLSRLGSTKSFFIIFLFILPYYLLVLSKHFAIKGKENLCTQFLDFDSKLRQPEEAKLTLYWINAIIFWLTLHYLSHF